MSAICCDICHKELIVGEWPYCPHGVSHYTAIGDACDVVQENGFAHPTRFTSKRALDRALAAKDLEIRVRHKPVPGTDKSPHTSDWSRGTVDLVAAAALCDPARRSRSATSGADGHVGHVPIEWTIRGVA
jgi:hypothetical protein